MEEIQALAKRIEINHDDLEAWQELGELVKDPKKEKDCRDQVTRINNARSGFHDLIRCERCGASMQVIPGEPGKLPMAVCPDCTHTKELENDPNPGVQVLDGGASAESAPASANMLQGRLTYAALIVSNILPVFGILFFGWSLGSILLLYWIENVIAGLSTVIKMALCKVDARGVINKLALIPFFCVHYGTFCAVHLSFIFFFILMQKAISGSIHENLLYRLPSLVLDPLSGLSIPALGMFISYGISFYQNYIKNGMYRYASLTRLMFEPYPRIIPLHIGLLLGGCIIIFLGSPVWIVLILVAIKTGADVLAHRHSMVKWRLEIRGRDVSSLIS